MQSSPASVAAWLRLVCSRGVRTDKSMLRDPPCCEWRMFPALQLRRGEQQLHICYAEGC